MDLQLDGKRALVTGSSGGIGEAIANALAAEGAPTAVHGRDAAAVARVVDEIHAAGGTAVATVGDLTDAMAAKAVHADVLAALGGLDILVNNVGLYQPTSWDETDADQWRTTYDANVVTTVRLTRLFLPAMRAQRFGRVIQIATGEATNPFPNMPDYAASKAAIVNLTVSLAKALDASGVTANTISPGIVVTPGVEAFFRAQAPARGWGESWEQIETGVLRDWLHNYTGRLGRPEDVANVALFLASPLSSYVTGANYRVDGGSTAAIN
jgi:3-oxoacyl-[acyl-carrier protein] reductase